MTTKTKKMVIITSTNLPVFSGFYNTLLGDKLEVDYQIESINEKREEIGLDSIDFDDLKIDYPKAKQELSKKIFKAVLSELKKLEIVEGGKFEKLVSPNFYNFSNDSIECEFQFSKKNVDNIKDYIKDNYDAWSKYLVENFTSYEGFRSFYENHPNGSDWSDLTEVLEHEAKCWCVLDFILLNEEYNSESIYYQVELYMSDYITNYDELIG